MKRPWELAIAWAICGCAPQQSSTPATQAAVDALGSAYIGCMARAASTYDDHRSEAAYIGAKVNYACRAEFDRWLQNRAMGLTPDEKRAFFESMQRRGPGIGTDVVLKMRAAAQQ